MAVGHFGEAKIGYVRLTIGIEQNVARLQVAMEYSPLMSVVDRASNRCHQPDHGRLSISCGRID